MRTWLFTWNPSRWAWDSKYDGYLELINQISQTGISYKTWSCGNNKSIKEGDRIFLIRLGIEPKGIMASGYAATDVFEGPHWDSKKDLLGIRCRRIYIKFDKILDSMSEDIILMSKLLEINPKYKWSSQTSGIEIPSHIAQEIEKHWNSI